MNDVMKHYQQILAVCHFLAAGEWQPDQLEVAADEDDETESSSHDDVVQNVDMTDDYVDTCVVVMDGLEMELLEHPVELVEKKKLIDDASNVD